MKISDINQKANDIYMQNALASQQMASSSQATTQVQQNDSASNRSDRVDISSSSRLLQRVNRSLDLSDTQRTAKVQQLQAQIQAGNYQVAPDKVAGAMMKDLIKEIG